MTERVSARDIDYVRIDDGLINQAIEVLSDLKNGGLRVVSAESCTGGLIAMVLSEAPGAADYFEGGFVVYTAEQKHSALSVSAALIDKHGAVSAEVALAMAEGALSGSTADIAVSITGVAGPEPDEKGNPIGLVYFGCARRGQRSFHRKKQFGEQGRSKIRYAAAKAALEIVRSCALEEKL